MGHFSKIKLNLFPDEWFALINNKYLKLQFVNNSSKSGLGQYSEADPTILGKSYGIMHTKKQCCWSGSGRFRNFLPDPESDPE